MFFGFLGVTYKKGSKGATRKASSTGRPILCKRRMQITIPLEVVAAPMDIMMDITLNTIKQLFYARKINADKSKRYT